MESHQAIASQQPESFGQTMALLNAYIQEKKMNNFLMAWVNLKSFVSPCTIHYNIAKTNQKTSNHVEFSNVYESRNYSRSQRPIFTDSINQKSISNNQEQQTPKYGCCSNISSEDHLKNSLLLEGLTGSQSDQFEDLVLERLAKLEQKVKQIKKSHREIRSKTHHQQVMTDKFSLNPKYIKLTDQSFRKQSQIEERSLNYPTQKTIPRLELDSKAEQSKITHDDFVDDSDQTTKFKAITNAMTGRSKVKQKLHPELSNKSFQRTNKYKQNQSKKNITVIEKPKNRQQYISQHCNDYEKNTATHNQDKHYVLRHHFYEVVPMGLMKRPQNNTGGWTCRLSIEKGQ